VDHATFRRSTYFPALDGLRAVSVLLVFAFHLPGAPLRWLHGGLGVEVFFVLSGFLITTLLAREEEERGEVDLRGFYIRRATRILPLYLVVLLAHSFAVLVLGVDDRRDEFLDALPYYLGFLQEVPLFQDIDRPFGVSWSLGIEEKFYFLWPLLGFAVLATVRARAGVAAVLAALTFGAGWIEGGEYIRPYFGILMGVLLALLVHPRRSYGWIAPLGRPIACAGALLVVAALQGSQHHFGREFPLLYSGSVAVLVFGLAAGTGWVPQLMGAAPMRWVGRRSYAVYLIHTLVIATLVRAWRPGGEPLADVGFAALALLVTLVLAEVLHRLIEVPCIEWGRRKSRRAVATVPRAPSEG
jgi:peptidoglycan/LPS O-acetylase OafA/YrhL